MYHFFVTKNGEQCRVSQDFYAIIYSLVDNIIESGIVPDDTGRLVIGNSSVDGFISIEGDDLPISFYLDDLKSGIFNGGIEQDLHDLLLWFDARDILIKKVYIYLVDDLIIKVNYEALSIR